MTRLQQDLPAARKASAEAQAKVKAENDVFTPMCRACEIYGPDQHPCCGEVDSMGCVFEVEDTRITQGAPHE